jgi:hypothetical protein
VGRREGQPRLVELPKVCRAADGHDPLEAPNLIPSVIEFLARPDIAGRIGAWRPLERIALIGSRAKIGGRLRVGPIEAIGGTPIVDIRRVLN